MRVWIDLTNSPHVLVMRPVIERLRADGHEVRVTARDFAQTIELCERLGIAHTADRPPPRRAARRQGRRACVALGGARALGAAPSRAAGGRRFDVALGHGSNDVSVAAALAADPERDDVRLRVGDRPAQRQLPPGARGGGARGDPAARLQRYGASGKLRRYAGLKEEYYLADFEPDRAVLEQLALDPARPIVVVRTPPEVSLYHRFENDLFAQVLERLRSGRGGAGRAAGGAAAGGRAARGAARGTGLRGP